MYATEFDFNGIKSGDIGFYILSFDSANDEGVASVGNEITFTTTKPAASDKNIFHGYSAETPLSTKFQIGKYRDGYEPLEFTREDCAFLLRWLERTDGYKFLRFFQKDYENTFFNAKIHIEWIRYGGIIVGADLTVSCDAPYGYSGIQSCEFELCDGDSFTIYNDSDKPGSINIENVDILIKSDGNLKITNNMEELYNLDKDVYTIIGNCVSGETISISNHQIETTRELNHTNQSIVEDFNYNYPRLINFSDRTTYSETNNYATYDEKRVNTFTVTGCNCNIAFTYRTIRTVMP